VPYRATGKSWQMDDAGGPGPRRDPALGAFLEEVAEVGERRLESTRLAMRLTPAEKAGFEERVQELLDEFVSRPADPEGEKWSLHLGMHPEL
jgi:hypothetical protein